MIKGFPKIFHIGDKYIKDIFNGEVFVEEKIDGSFFSFAKIKGEMIYRSKGKRQMPECPDKLFKEGINYLESIKKSIPEGIQFYAEYLKKPKHNTLNYDRVPKNHFMLFSVENLNISEFIYNRDMLKIYADQLNIECVPTLFRGKINNAEDLKKFLDQNSVLGGQKVEGVVVKNYKKDLLIGGQVFPIMCGKYVSEEFKEIHRKNWSKENTGKGRWDTFKSQYKSEARWNKAVIHLKEKGELEGSPRDIGKLMKEVCTDIDEECKEEIKEFLYKEFGKDLKRQATHGMPEWYKEKLLKDSFGDKE